MAHKKQVEAEEVRLQPLVSAETVERIDRLAKALNLSRNDAVRWLLEMATTDLEYIGNLAVARVSGAVNAMCKDGKAAPSGRA